MRLICPNCDAQYEVPDDAIPEEGRDVQCSNCGNTWFFYHPNFPPTQPDDTVSDDPDEEIIKTEDPSYDDANSAPEEAEAQADDVDATSGTTEDADPMFDEAPAPTAEAAPEVEDPQPRGLDPNVADILREEAELELSARQHAMGAPVESQPDLGLDDLGADEESERRAREAADRMARMRGETPEPPPAGASGANSRRDLLPDIEEINSTLRSSEDRGADDPAELANIEVREKRGFRNGFSLVILLVAALAVLYTFAPQLAQAVPALEPSLTAFVEFVNGLRTWLDAQITSLLTRIDDAATAANG